MVWAFFWVFFVFGLVYFGVGASITAAPRNALYNWLGRRGSLGNGARGVLACAPCFSFWVGAVLGLPDTAALAHMLPVWLLSSTSLVFWSNHAAGAFVAMGLVSCFQFATGMVISAIARTEAEEGK